MPKISGLQDLIRIRLVVRGDGVLSCGEFLREVRMMLERSKKLSVGKLAAFFNSEDRPISGRRVVAQRVVTSETELCVEMADVASEEAHEVLNSENAQLINGLLVRPLSRNQEQEEQAALIIDCVDHDRKLFVAYRAIYCPGQTLGNARSYRVIKKEVSAF